MHATDASTSTLRTVLKQLGYRTYGWRLGRNNGPTSKVVHGMRARLDYLTNRHQRPVTLIGWSLGGIYARQLARRTPQAVRQVITLSSPIRLVRYEQSRANRLFHLYAHQHIEPLNLPLEHDEGPLPVPATSIYTPLDGIVAWRTCLDEPSPRAENIAVLASHFGIANHPAALWAIADRLAQPADQWKPFQPPPLLRDGLPSTRKLIMTNLANILTESARRHPDRPAIRLDDILITYAELDELTARAAGWLRARGIEPGDRVAIALPNVVPFPVFYYGVLRVGATVVPMNPLLKSREIEHHLGDSGAKLALVWSTVAAEAESAAKATGTDVVVIDDDTIAAAADWPSSPAVAARDDADTAVILYTSGTTGAPKGAQLTHANLYRNALAFTGLFDLCQNDVVLGCLPLFHAFGQSNGLNASIAVGASVSLVPRFEPTAVLQLIERHRVTVFEGVPTMYVTLLHTDADGVDAIQPADVCLGRCSATGRSAERLPGNLRRTDPRRLRTVRDLTDRRVQPPRANQSRFDRTAPRRCRNEIGQPGRHRNPARRGRRNRHPRAQRDEGLLEAARRHRGRDRRRLVPHRRHGHPRRRRLLLHRRPQEGHHHPRRLQRLSTRNRRSPLRTPRSPRSRRDRGAPRHPRRRGRCRRRATPRYLTRLPTSSATTSRPGLPPTSTRDLCGLSTLSPRVPPARSSNAKSKLPPSFSIERPAVTNTSTA